MPRLARGSMVMVGLRVSIVTFMFGSMSASSAGKSRFWTSTVRTANQKSPSLLAVKLKNGLSGVVTATLVQLRPRSADDQSWICL